MKRLLIPVLPLLLATCARLPWPSAPAATAPQAATASADAAGLDAQTLAAYRWQLGEARDAQGQRIGALFARAGRPLTLEFQPGRISVANSCNRMSGGYRIDGDQLAVDRLASTMMACADPALAALDQAIGRRLEGRSSASVQRAPEKLVLTRAGGDTLVFDGVPTPETRYGGPGERAFLEVAARTQPCRHPLIPDKQCLQVREVFYDDNGLKTGTPGEFRDFYGDIEGYVHEPGVRNVLRVERFRRDPAPADAPDAAYVLDRVVESETEKP
jgi:heat shock protein HslJ